MNARAIAIITFFAFAPACHTRTAADPSQEEQAARETEEGDGKDSEGDAAKGDKDDKHEDGNDEKGGKHEGEDSDAKGASRTTASSAAPKEHSGSSSKAKDSKEQKKDSKDEDGIDPEDIEVSTSPQGLLKPGAEEQLRQKLGVEKGKAWVPALRKFQREHDLPATGMVDHETATQLGLDPSDIFEKAD